MSYIALGLMSGLLLGVWKFGLSVYRGQISVYSIVFVSASAAALAYLAAGMLSGTLIFDSEDVVEGFLGGLCNLAGTLCFITACTHHDSDDDKCEDTLDQFRPLHVPASPQYVDHASTRASLGVKITRTPNRNLPVHSNTKDH